MTGMPSPPRHVIELSQVTKVYGEGEGLVRALRGIDLAIAPGEFVAVMGPSGSGKSTCMNILGCLDTPTSGAYRFLGVPVGSMTPDQRALLRRNHLGFVFQGFNLLTRTTALDNVELPLLYRAKNGFKSAERHKRALASLDAVGLSSRYHHMPNQLSGGQQQRVAIARALVNEPSLILADEPTGNLDTRTSIEVIGIFQRLNKERGITVLLITHEMDIAEYGTRLIRFRDGRVVADQPIPHRRNAADELAALPPPEPDLIPPPAEAAH
jgi:putative ABC transport system ATP-binding protein